MRYFIETYGCQMNKAESAAMEIDFKERSWSKANEPEEADLVMINTCSVRITAENRAWGRIAHYAAKKKERPFTLIVTGCMAERLKAEMIAKQPAIDFVLGNFQKPSLGRILDFLVSGGMATGIEESPVFSFAESHWEEGSFRSFLPIMHGCDNFCSYCIVPHVRGREVSRSLESVLEELDGLSTRGVREVTLLGQNVNSWRWEQDGKILLFPDLLKAVADRARRGTIGRIRFVSSHPKDLSDETIAVIATDPLLAKHVHLCVQHGADRVLASMNRKYTSGFYMGLVDRMRKAIPDLSLSTDILIGFPGETEEDVQETLSLMREARFAYAYMYHYNPRTGTPAASLPDQIPDAVKKERLAKVIALQKELTREAMRSFIGREFEVLVEGPSSKNPDELLARTDHDMMVVFSGGKGLIGGFAKVRLLSLRGNTFKAEEVR
jgi:tRNA-2-methylthio-N6-dimethylallyladenosine synthase